MGRLLNTLKYDIHYETTIDRGDAPYGRDDEIVDVTFKSGIDSDKFGDVYRRNFDGTDRQERAYGYAASRIGSMDGVWNSDYWQAEVEWGYYGQEVRGVRHDYEERIARRLEKCENMILDEEIRETVLQLLEWEYGFVLDPLKQADFSEERVRADELHTPNERYAGKVSDGDYEVNTDWPIGVYLDREVIDGYNRLAHLRSENPNQTVWIYNFS